VVDITYCALFAALIASGAFVAVPVGPVPFTLQTLFVVLAGMILGPRRALLSVVVYLSLGLAAPVYAGGGCGVGTLIGPTGGFLLGFLPAAYAVGSLSSSRDPSVGRMVCAGLGGLLPLYALGVAWLAAQQDLGLAAAAGVLPFLAADVVKVGLAAAVASRMLSRPLGLPVPQRDR